MGALRKKDLPADVLRIHMARSEKLAVVKIDTERSCCMKAGTKSWCVFFNPSNDSYPRSHAGSSSLLGCRFFSDREGGGLPHSKNFL